MDERIEAFFADVLALEGEKPEAIGAGERIALGDAVSAFREREDNRRMKDRAVHACHALCRSRLVEEMRRRKGTPTADHLKLVLGILDKPTHLPSNDR